MNDCKIFSKALVAARKGAGLSRASLASKLGVSLYTVIDWENGRHLPSRLNLRAIRLALPNPGPTPVSRPIIPESWVTEIIVNQGGDK